MTLLCLAAAGLGAQTTIWVSGTGNDGNSGARTTPCATFSGAQSKTAADGQILALDAGDFGPIIITKALTLDGGSPMATITSAPTTSAIVIQAGASDVVVLKNLRIKGDVPMASNFGIDFVSGKALIVENCTIDGFSLGGIRITTASSAANIYLSKVSISHANDGVYVGSTSTAVDLRMDRVQTSDCGHSGFYLMGPGRVMATNCSATGSTFGLALGKANAQVDGLRASMNTCGVDLVSGTLRLGNCVISGNSTGVQVVGGTLSSYGNNQVDGNTGGNGPFTTISSK